MGNRISLKHVIPEEIIEEILCNLPVKSLLRFKSVSKRWRFVISSEYFIKKHLNKSCADGSKHVFGFEHRKTHFLSLGSCSLRDEPVVTTNMDIQIRPVKKKSDREITICTGDLIMWNPSTRKTKYIKNSAPFIRGVGYGFGYDELSEDYKVVIIKDGQHGQQHKTPTRTRKYSSKTDSWKEIENLKKCFFQYDGKFVNGRLHWLVGELGCGWDIVPLDLAEEKYVIMARP